jgi:small-conductance mechanosensitive channel
MTQFVLNVAQFFESVARFIEDHLGLPWPVQAKLLQSLLVVALFVLLRWVVSRLIGRRFRDAGQVYLVSKTTGYVLGLVALIVLARVWLGGVVGLGAYLGIASAGLAIALQDPLTNLVGWFYIVARRPFTAGDRIEIGGHAGDVIDISLLHFTLVEIGGWVDADQSTGRVIHLPNGWVFKQSTANYTQGFEFVWNELPVTVTFESNWTAAKKILGEIAARHTAIKSEQAAKQVRRASRKFLISFQHLTPIVWTSVADHGVTLTIRYLCHPRRRRGSAGTIWEDILKAFAARDDIDFAYPTQRFYNNAIEGKSQAGGPGKAATSGE